jgi:hypothetical protein
MTRRKRTSKKPADLFIALARDLRVKLHEMDQKLEHLIRSHRHFYSLHYKERELDD